MVIAFAIASVEEKRERKPRLVLVFGLFFFLKNFSPTFIGLLNQSYPSKSQNCHSAYVQVSWTALIDFYVAHCSTVCFLIRSPSIPNLKD